MPTDNPWPIALVALLFAALLIWLAQRSGRFLFAALALACVALAGASFLADYLVETPRERIVATVDTLIAAAVAGDSDVIINAIADDYSFERHTKRSLSDLIRGELKRSRISAIRLSGMEVAVNDDKASASFLALVEGQRDGLGGNYPLRVTLQFDKRPIGWKITRVSYRGASGEPDPVLPIGR